MPSVWATGDARFGLENEAIFSGVRFSLKVGWILRGVDHTITSRKLTKKFVRLGIIER